MAWCPVLCFASISRNTLRATLPWKFLYRLPCRACIVVLYIVAPVSVRLQERLKLSQAEGTARALEERAAAGQSTVEEVLGVAGDGGAEALDREKGADLRDPGVFRAHAARYEKEVRGGDGGACL